MNPLPSASRNPSRRHPQRSEIGYLLSVTVPPLLLLLLFAFGEIREHAAQSRYEVQVAKVRALGLPTDSHSSAVAFDGRLSTDNSITWKNVLAATEELNGRFYPAMIAIDELTATIPPGDDWESEPIIRLYTEQSRPILQTIDALAEDDRAVWEPLVLEGYSTLLPDLQASRSVIRLLVVEFRHAVHQGQHDRAIHALQSILDVGNAFDWQIGLISDFIFMTHRATHRELIRRSLEVEFWQTEQQFQQLQQQLAESDDLDARWRRALASEMAMLMSELRIDREDPEFAHPPLNLMPFGIPPSTKSGLVETMESASELSGAGTLAHVRAIEKGVGIGGNVATESVTTTINGFPFAFSDAPLGLLGQTQNYVSAARAFAKFAMERRWTVTAVALEQFRLQQGRWPSELSELASVGLSRRDWTAIGDEPFGYRVEGDPPEAILWTIPASELSDLRIPPDPPSATEEKPDRVPQTVVRLR